MKFLIWVLHWNKTSPTSSCLTLLCVSLHFLIFSCCFLCYTSLDSVIFTKAFIFIEPITDTGAPESKRRCAGFGCIFTISHFLPLNSPFVRESLKVYRPRLVFNTHSCLCMRDAKPNRTIPLFVIVCFLPFHSFQRFGVLCRDHKVCILHTKWV